MSKCVSVCVQTESVGTDFKAMANGGEGEDGVKLLSGEADPLIMADGPLNIPFRKQT